MRRYRRNAGFSLIEVLVALLILSIGLIGLAGLQNRGLRDNHSALLRSQAVQHAEDMLDRMRANRAAAQAGRYDIEIGKPGPADWSGFDDLRAKLTGSYTGITLSDLTEWKFALVRSLPFGDGSVAVNGGVVTVRVEWAERGGVEFIESETRL